MFDDVRLVRDHARDEDLAIWQLDILPHHPLVLVARVGRLDHVGLRMDLEHHRDNARQRCVLGMRLVHAAPAVVIADPRFGNPAQRVIDDLDALLERMLHVRRRKVGNVGEHHLPVGVECGEIHLHQQPGVGNSLVLLVERVGDGVQICGSARIEALDVLVIGSRCGDIGRDETVDKVETGHRRLECVDVPLDRGVARVANGASHPIAMVVTRQVRDAPQRNFRRHPQIPIVLVVLGKELREERLLLRIGVQPGVFVRTMRPGCQAIQPLVDVPAEALAAKFAVAGNVDADVSLPADNLDDALLHITRELLRVVVLVEQTRPDPFEDGRRAHQAANVGRENAICTPLQVGSPYSEAGVAGRCQVWFCRPLGRDGRRASVSASAIVGKRVGCGARGACAS